jgi:hypothetical protein
MATERIYLADGREVRADVSLGLGGRGMVIVDDQEIKVARLAAPYQYRDYGEVVNVTLQDGRVVATTLRAYEYENHMAQIDVAAIDRAAVIHQDPGAVVICSPHVITAIYDQSMDGRDPRITCFT